MKTQYFEHFNHCVLVIIVSDHIFDETPENYDYGENGQFEGHKYIDNVYFHPEFKFKDKDGQVYFIFDYNGDVIGTSDQIIAPSRYI